MKKLLFVLFLSLSVNCHAAAIDGILFGAQRIFIAPIGDSITAGTTTYDNVGLPMAYRDHLQDLLRTRYGLVFTGNTATPASDSVYLTSHWGGIGLRTDQILTVVNAGSFTSTSAYSAYYCLIHAGTNDVGQSVADATSVGYMEDIIDALVADNAENKIYVALIIPSGGSNTNIIAYNTALNTMLETKQATNSNIVIVDMYNLFVNDTTGLCDGDYANVCLSDVTHPSETGWIAMARQWAACMASPTAVNCNGN